MSQQQKLEQVLDLLLSEDSDQAATILHQIIVEKARLIYETIVSEDAEEESKDVVGGEPNKDFTDEIETDKDEVDSDELNDGEADADDAFDDEGDGEEEAEGSTEDRVEDLESQLAELRAEFDALMGEEMQEPEHADMADEFGDEESADFPGMDGEEKVVGEVVATMFERKAKEKLEKAKEAKKGELLKKGKKPVEEETKFTTVVGDTGQRGTAKLVGTGKDMPLGAEQTKSTFTKAPAKPSYGGEPAKIGGGTGGEYGKWNGDSAKAESASDNVNVKPKSSGIKADATPKFTGGKTAGEEFKKSPLSKRPTPATKK